MQVIKIHVTFEEAVSEPARFSTAVGSRVDETA